VEGWKGFRKYAEAHPAIVKRPGARLFGIEIVKAGIRLQDSVSFRSSDKKSRLRMETEQLQRKQLTFRFSYAQSNTGHAEKGNLLSFAMPGNSGNFRGCLARILHKKIVATGKSDAPCGEAYHMSKSHSSDFHGHSLVPQGSWFPALLLAAFLFSPVFLHAGQFKVTEVLDGDTVRIEGHGTEINVRLAGIDAPKLCPEENDLAQPFSREAKDYLEELILDKSISIKSFGEKRYGLLWGEIFLGDKNVNLEIVRAGYAETYRGKSPEKLDLAGYFEAEKEAKEAKRGVWSLGKKYISPQAWQKRQKARCSFATILYELLHQKGKK
jgi:micrococcal nuclease